MSDNQKYFSSKLSDLCNQRNQLNIIGYKLNEEMRNKSDEYKRQLAKMMEEYENTLQLEYQIKFAKLNEYIDELDKEIRLRKINLQSYA